MWLMIFLVFFIAMSFFFFKYLLIPLLRFVFEHMVWIVVFGVCLLIPGFLDECFAVIALIIMAVCGGIHTGGSGGGTYYDTGYDHYILNKRSKVAHHYYSDSADTVSERNRREIFASREELSEKGYRIKDS